MTYSFDQTYTALDTNLLAAIFSSAPSGALDAVEDIIDDTLTGNPSATEKDILSAFKFQKYCGRHGIYRRSVCSRL